ncbi:MAG: hypothetical protein D4R68_01680 [Ignavibacteriales bacterium]|nr:MAG: hypothetical protein D4R68_01680 [Ignavibacteriales bacterium]
MRIFLKATFVLVLFLPLISNCQNAQRDSFYVANWNVENLFDTIHDPVKDDKEFLPDSPRQWNDEKYEQKLTNLAKVINYMNNGCGPDILAVEEVENINVLKRLIYKLRDRDYMVAHRDSPDARGIDVGLLYDRSIFDIDSLAAIHVELPDHNPTRDILHVVLIHKKSKEKVHVYVNHWPSRRGGEQKSNSNRVTAAEVLKSSLDTLALTSPKSNVIILGDFNDEPNNESIEQFLGAKDFDCGTATNSVWVNLAYKKFSNKEGSYFFGGKFDMIDQIIISTTFLDGKRLEYECNSFDVIKPPFMISQKGNREGGAIPTFNGNIYVGGYSDHYPVGAKFRVKGKK